MQWGTHAGSDRAIVAIAILRALRKPDQKGVGANRDDHPIFSELSNIWARGESPPKELLFQGRHRVQKYKRQINESPYADQVTGGDIKDLLRTYAKAERIAFSENTLHNELQAITGYGNW